ncbi:50S ribosomal protein L21 [Candidatus Omnitrophota bacterium]
MYVVLETGGRQYKVSENEEFLVNRMEGKESSAVKFKHILLAKDKNTVHIGTPYLKEAHVTCEILSHPRAKKVVAFKYKRRKSYHKTIGHRQDLTRLRVKEIKV